MIIRRLGAFNLAKLAEEIESAGPELFSLINGERKALYGLNYRDPELILTLPDSANAAKFNTILDNHDPRQDSKNQARTRLKIAAFAQIEAAFISGSGISAQNLRFVLEYLHSKQN